MKKIFGLVLALVMIVSVFAVFPASAEDNVDSKWNVMLNDGINLNYYEGDVKVGSVNVAAKEMAATQAVNGQTTSVEAYLKGLIAGEYGAATKTLAQALLNYGAAAYEYFAANNGYVGTPVDGDPVTDTAALKAADAPEVSIVDDGIYMGATLVLDGTMQLRFYFNGNGLEANYQDNDQVSIDKDGYCYFDAPVMPYAMSESVTIVVGDTTVTYAPINYLQAKADDPTLSEMVASIYAYGVAAEAYYVSDGCEHKDGIVFEITTYPTLFTEGAENKCCEICGKVLETDLPMDKTTATIVDIDNTYNPNKQAPNGTGSIGDALGNKTFQPGNDLYIEYSILWNDTMSNNSGKGFGLGQIANRADATLEGPSIVKQFSWLYYNEDAKWCNFKGGFEFSEAKEFKHGPVWQENSNNADDFVIIDGLDGWHRIGVKYSQNYYEKNGEFTYDVTATVYVDGVRVSEQIMDWGAMFYSVEVDDEGKLVYVQNEDIANYYAVFYRIGSPGTAEGVHAYFVFADMYLTVGDGFAVNVTPITNPEANDFAINEEVTLSGKQYFKVQGQSDCDVGNHTWAESATVDTEVTCTTDGQKSIKCTICKEIKEDTIEVIPAGHAWGLPTVDTEATCTTEGQKSIKCTVCNEVQEGSVEVIPAGHTWAENATVDTEATCTTEGQKSIKCTVCGDTKDGSVEVIPTAGHKGIEVTTVPTVFSDGVKSGTCTVCGTFISENIAKAEATIIDGKNYSSSKAPNATANIGDALGDKTFQPGKDLYLEYSILWNDTMANASGSGIGFGHISLDEDITREKVDGKSRYVHEFSWLYYKADATWCPFVGGFEFSGAKSFVDGPVWQKNNNNPDDFVIIDGLDGWHRIGVKYSQNYYENNGEFTYDVTATVYVDGVKVSEQILDWGAQFYSVEREGDNLVYIQNEDVADYYAVFYRVGSPNLSKGEHAYFVFADMYLTVGDGFVLDAVPVENPRANSFSQDGVTLDGKQYFRLKGDCDLGIHTWDAEATVDFEPTCTTDGQKSVKCSICNATNPDSIEVIKSAGQHVVPDEGAVVIKVPTAFSEGEKTGTCTECGEIASAPIAKTEATIIDGKNYSSSKAPNATANIGDALGDKTFQPGKDLYLEYSILFNDTMANASGSGIGFGHISLDEDITREEVAGKSRYVHAFSWLYYKNGSVWCPFAGGFEFSEGVKEFVVGPEWKKNGTESDYTIIQGLDGWHRIGLQYHQNYYEKNGSFTYDVTITVYVDGVKTNEIIVDWGDMFYSVEREGDNLVYIQNEDVADYYAVFYRIGNPNLSKGEHGYFVFADMYLTVGDGFVLDVSSVENPEAQEFTQDGVTLSGKQYFTVNN